MNSIPITSLDDPRVAVYRDLPDRDLAGEQGLFMAEGELVVRRLVEESPLVVRSLFLSEKRFRAMEPWLDERAAGAPIYVASQETLDAVAGFHLHRGVLAAGERPPRRDARALLADTPTPAIVVVLEDLANHDNVGGIFRSASAFGVAGVILTNRCVDPLYRKATRVSIGATLTMPFARERTGRDALDALHGAGFVTVAMTPGADATELGEWLARAGSPERLALLLGAEGAGLKETTLAGAAARGRLGRMVGVDSLNVAVAAGIALYEIASSRR